MADVEDLIEQVGTQIRSSNVVALRFLRYLQSGDTLPVFRAWRH